MGKDPTFDFREFLSKPRSLHEIAEHYGVSKKAAAIHLRDAVKSGQVLLGEASMLQAIKDSSGNLKKLKGFVYVCRELPILAARETKFSAPKVDTYKRELLNGSHLTFSNCDSQSTKATLERGELDFAFAEKTNLESSKARIKANHSLISKLKVSAAKVSSVNHARSSRLQLSKPYSSSKPAPQLNVEKIRFFQALQKKPLPFSDIHNQFTVSRQTITRLQKKGLLVETWGSKGVGVRFKLTSKGKAWLAQLEEASKFEPRIRKSSLTRLKQRSVV